MRYIKKYKIFESSDKDLEVLFGSLNDSEFQYTVKNNVVSIIKKRMSGMTVLKSIFNEDDRYEINSIINQVLVSGYELDGEIEYQQKKGSVLSNPVTGKTVLTGEVTDIDIKSFMDQAQDNTEFLIKTKGLLSYKIPRKSGHSIGYNDKPFDTQMLIDNANDSESRVMGSGTRKVTLFKRGEDTTHYCFLYKRKGGYSEYGRFTIEYLLIPKEEVDILVPSIFKVKLKLI